ncbi:hypothetical protein GJ744_010379 [Endocarpon pusillum]|uniref:Major facilitator superfamily (MFS) profile domain-containing protein n=1 Tax=Endocarpon pusillum TaxID=364733 RepID=A0A8H7E444_9EURO|nr:hypothetical protein GJ744_010379 [Endocarpon pusillum]
MENTMNTSSHSKGEAHAHHSHEASASNSTGSDLEMMDSPREDDPALGLERNLSPRSDAAQTIYRVYKRRFFGLSQLVLLNIVVSWDWLSFSPVSKTSAEYFATSETAINWLSTSFQFSFCVASPFTIYSLNKTGPKGAIIVASCLILVGNWIRYGGTRVGNFGAVMFGQILVGLAQPFVLSAPTRYSDVWFSEKGRVSATAVASLANPFGGALAQLINPLWASRPSDIPDMILYVSIICTIACVPSFFIPSAPPRPQRLSRFLHSTQQHPRLTLRYHPHPHYIAPQPPDLPPQLPPNPPLLDLRRPLQFLLLPAKPIPLPLRLHRNASRHRRRPPHPRRPRLRRPLLPANRPLQILSPLPQNHRPNHRVQLSSIRLGAGESHPRLPLHRPQCAGRREFRLGSCGVGVFG